MDVPGFRNAGDDLDFEVETRQPVDAERRPVRIGRFVENAVLHGHDCAELLLRIGVECGHVDYIVERAAGCFQSCTQIVERELDLAFKIGFWASICPAANLAGDE